jgi:hypothetical protein
MMEMSITVLSNLAATGYMCLLNTIKMSSETRGLYFTFSFILINLKVNTHPHMTIGYYTLDSAGLERSTRESCTELEQE